MLRNTFLVLDCSRWSREKDPALPPARMRLETILTLASQFVNEFYDQNPLGHYLGVVICRDGEAEMLTSLGGSPKKHKLATDASIVTEMGRKDEPDIGGEFSLQNGIEVAGRLLGYAPRYGSREFIVIMSALVTCDPGDILGETLPRLLHAGIRMSTISLQSEVHLCK
jgi:transcription initiation factor TFIIH subunit 2